MTSVIIASHDLKSSENGRLFEEPLLSQNQQRRLQRLIRHIYFVYPLSLLHSSFREMSSTVAASLGQQAPPAPVSSPSDVTISTTTSSSSTSSTPEPLILTARPPDSHVLVIRLNRPRVLNALSSAMVDLLLSALKSADTDPDIGAIVITGNDKAFAGKSLLKCKLTSQPTFLLAGADIKEIASLSFPSLYMQDYLRGVSEGISSFKKPIIAAVNGHAVR